MSTGSSYTLICKASLIDRFIVLPQIKWEKNTEESNLVFNSGSSVRINGSDLQLVFDSLNASNAGKYICTVTLKITEINLTLSSNSSETIYLQSKLCVIYIKNEYIISTSFRRIPQVQLLTIFTIAILYHLFFYTVPNPTLSVQVSRLTDHVAGSPLNITCNIMPVVANIDIHTTINVVWKKNDKTIVTSDHVFISELFIDSTKMSQSILIIKSLSITFDSANFTCHVVIQSNQSSFYVQNAMTVAESTYLIVTGNQRVFK